MVPPDRVGQLSTPEIAASRSAAVSILGYFYLGVLLKAKLKVNDDSRI
jgi:hypothetical protein